LSISSAEPDPQEVPVEAERYEILRAEDVDTEPPAFRPLGPGDVFLDIGLGHLAEPISGPVMVVGHPCSLRRGLTLKPDIPVAPIIELGIPTNQLPYSDRCLPVRKMLPPGSSTNRVVDLTLATTTRVAELTIAKRCASLSNAGIVALQQRLVGNAVRVKVPPGIITKHCRGPLTELELWTDWREAVVEAGYGPELFDVEFDELMKESSGFGGLSWRDAIAEHEHSRGSAATATDKRVAELLAAYEQPSG
jgi:hypothetical protein